jgi:hypothetical protein
MENRSDVEQQSAEPPARETQAETLKKIWETPELRSLDLQETEAGEATTNDGGGLASVL